jgi:hypothetical protein
MREIWIGKREKAWPSAGTCALKCLRPDSIRLLKVFPYAPDDEVCRFTLSNLAVNQSWISLNANSLPFPYWFLVQEKMKEDRNWFKPWVVRPDQPSAPPCSSSSTLPTHLKPPTSEQLNYYAQAQESATKRHGSASSKSFKKTRIFIFFSWVYFASW